MGRWAPPEVVSAAISGDVAAIERLVVDVWPGCFRLAASVLGDRGLAQDAAQESCVAVHRKIRTLRRADAFDAWLYRIVMREASRVRRRNASVDRPLFEDGFSHEGTASIDVWRALSSLPAPQRDVVVLFYFDDLKTEEIAAILRVPHATVRTRLSRARDRLRDLLGDYGNDTGFDHHERKQHAF